MFRDAREARRTLRLMFVVAVLFVAGTLAFALLPHPYSDYIWMMLTLGAGFTWTYLGFQLHIGRTAAENWHVRRALLRQDTLTELALLARADEDRLVGRRRWLLRLFAVSAALALIKLLWRSA